MRRPGECKEDSQPTHDSLARANPATNDAKQQNRNQKSHRSALAPAASFIEIRDSVESMELSKSSHEWHE
jgi:hypothetical protein